MERTQRRILEAAVAGNITTLLESLKTDELILDRIMVGFVAETPLHIAAMLGHADFAREILSRKPELARELNSQGSSPLHLASAKGHVEMVKELLRIDPDVCLVRDHEGRTPLHAAAIKGRIGVIKAFIHDEAATPKWVRALTDRGETILHLCVKYTQFEAIKLLVQSVDDTEFLNSKDDVGNTVLHLAAAKRQIQTIKFLLNSTGVEVNALNANGLTPLDVLVHFPIQSGDLEIGEMLRVAGAIRAVEMSRLSHDRTVANNHQMAPPLGLPVSPQPRSRWKKKMKKGKWLREDANTLMVVAILIATMTFEAGLNPPGGECAKLNANCTLYVERFYSGSYNATGNYYNATGNYYNATGNYTPIRIDYKQFMIVDTVGFLSSLSVIVLIISGFPFQRRYLKWLLIVIMMIALASVALLFTFWMIAMNPHETVMTNIPILWVGLIGLLFLWQLVRFGKWLFKKRGIIAKKCGIIVRKCRKIFKRERGRGSSLELGRL